MELLHYDACRYLNDVYTLEIREGTSLQWVCPTIEGPTPCPRESPAAVTVGNNRLLIYGGMNGKRLGDVWMLDVGEMKNIVQTICITLMFLQMKMIIMYIDFAYREEHLDFSGDPGAHPSPPQPPHGSTHQEQGVLIWRVGPCRFRGRKHPRPRDRVEVHQLSCLPKPWSVKHYDVI